MIPIYKPDLSGNEKKYLNECVESTWISSKGKFIEKFEDKFCKFTKSPYATTVSNGTVAIHLALKALGIGKDDEVIVPTLTYVASVNPIVQVGARPVFIDSLKTSWQLNPEDLKRKITKKTKAIMVVHLYGQAADMDAIMTLANENNLLVIEDCAEAFGSTYKGKHVGTFGDIGTFSFFGNKTITCGEGGMVISKSEDINARMKHLKNQGVSYEKQYWHDEVAYNYRMTNMQASIGLAQIERAEEFIQRKREIAALYKEYLSNTPIEIHNEQEDTYHSYWMVSILVNSSRDRQNLQDYLMEEGIETRPLFYPVHTMPMYKEEQCFPIAEDLGSRGLNLPSWPGLKNNEIRYICAKIKEYLAS